MSKVVSLADYKKNNEKLFVKESYSTYLNSLSHSELEEEMIKFQEMTKSRPFKDLDLIDQGLILFKVLHKNALSNEFKRFCHSYLKHLEFEKLRLKAIKL